jgi:hypothetical protein
MAGEHEPREGETPPSEPAPGPVRSEREWSQWERQKLDVYREEHPDAEPTRPTTGE